jgi:secreted trypsin-like serine protease
MPRLAVLWALTAAPALAAASPGAGGSSDPELGTISQPVVGGSMVPPGKWPDAVAVLGPKGTCSGTLIAPDVVLTAGHCAGIEPDEVAIDTTNYNGAGGQRRGVAHVTAYPEYQKSFDVAVVVLDRPVDDIAPRTIASACSYAGFSADTTVRLVGFGLTQADGGGTNTSLREAMAPVLDPDCSGGNGCRDAASPDGEFVAGGGGSDSCFGDSGGPVYLDTGNGPVLIASVSRGLAGNPQPCGGAGIYVRTDKLVPWLEKTTGRSFTTDHCTGELASENFSGPADDSVGCSAGGASSLAVAAIFVPLVLRRRRARS